MLDFNYVIEELEKIMNLYEIDLIDNTREEEPGVNTFKILIDEVNPSIDYRHYKFSVIINFGTNQSLNDFYTDEMDKAIRRKVQVNSLIPGKKKGLVTLSCELII